MWSRKIETVFLNFKLLYKKDLKSNLIIFIRKLFIDNKASKRCLTFVGILSALMSLITAHVRLFSLKNFYFRCMVKIHCKLNFLKRELIFPLQNDKPYFKFELCIQSSLYGKYSLWLFRSFWTTLYVDWIKCISLPFGCHSVPVTQSNSSTGSYNCRTGSQIVSEFNVAINYG